MKIALSTTLALAIAFAITLFILIASGEPPNALFESLVICFSSEGLGYTLYYATPLIFTGLSVAVSFHCGLFNIGGEGQLYLGSLGVVAIATLFPSIPRWMALPLGIGSAAIAGAIWGGLAGFLKGYRGSHEVIVTILLNFIVYAIVDYSILYLFKDAESQSPETALIPSPYHLSTFQNVSYFHSTPANTALFIALVAAVAVWLFLFRSRAGYELRAVGKNPIAARFAGIKVGRSTLIALGISGALSGLVGVNEVMGYEHRLIQGFSPQYGFTGIAVALMGMNHPVGVVFSAILFGTLHNMSREIEFLTTHVSKELSLVMQAILIAAVATLPRLPIINRNLLKGRKRD